MGVQPIIREILSLKDKWNFKAVFNFTVGLISPVIGETLVGVGVCNQQTYMAKFKRFYNSAGPEDPTRYPSKC